jgi:hypothetical protein
VTVEILLLLAMWQSIHAFEAARAETDLLLSELLPHPEKEAGNNAHNKYNRKYLVFIF